jgi:hypothetical protein
MTGHVAERPTDFSTALRVSFIASSFCSLSAKGYQPEEWRKIAVGPIAYWDELHPDTLPPLS